MAQEKTRARTQVKGTFEIKGWDEKTWDGKNWNEASGAKLTHARVTIAYHGGIEGEAEVQFLMAYRDDAFANILGLQRVTGQIGEWSGSFVLQDTGKFENGVATSSWSVLPGSGTGDFKGLRGEGGSTAEHDGKLVYTLEYWLE